MATRSREEFVKRWRGVWMMYGMDTLQIMRGETLDMRRKRADTLMDAPSTIDELLGRMFDDLIAKPENGKIDVKKVP